jgi:hypothetical protein
MYKKIWGGGSNRVCWSYEGSEKANSGAADFIRNSSNPNIKTTKNLYSLLKVGCKQADKVLRWYPLGADRRCAGFR